MDYNPLDSFHTIAPTDLDPFLAWKLYGAIKLNFTNEKYDYHEKGIPTSFILSAYNNRSDIYFFELASSKFLYQSRYLPTLVANIYLNRKFWIKSILNKQALTHGLAFRKYQNSFYNSFETEIQNVAFKYKLKSIEELYHPVYNTHYFELENKKAIHPITSAVLNHLYYDETLDWNNDTYKTNSYYLNKLLKFAIPTLDIIKVQTILDNIMLEK